MHLQGKRLLTAFLAMSLPACSDLGRLGDIFANPCGPGGCRIPQRPCAEFSAAALSWSLRGFEPADILNPDLRNQPELTAVLHVGAVKRLRVSATGLGAAEDCSSKAASVDWLVSNSVVARFEAAENPREASLVALQPGDTVVSATVTFQDGTPPLHVLPWSFTNIGSGTVTVVRVVP